MKYSTFKEPNYKKAKERACTQISQNSNKYARLSTEPTYSRQSIRNSHKGIDRSQMSATLNSLFRISSKQKLPTGIKNILKIEKKIQKLNQTCDRRQYKIKQTQKQNILKTFRNHHKAIGPFQKKLNLMPAQKMMIDFERQIKRIKKQLLHNKNDEVKQNKDRFEAFSISVCKQKAIQNQDSVKFGEGIHVLCDGHGSNGKEVSRFVCQNIYEKCLLRKKDNKINKSSLNQIFVTVSRELEFSGVDIAFSGSTCLVVICLDRQILIANVGDSKVIIRKQHKTQLLSNEHRPHSDPQRERVQSAGGIIRQMQISKGKFGGPLRIWAPGKNSWGPGITISRCFGNKAARRYGLISQPSISTYQITFDEHFLVLGTGGLFQALKLDEIIGIVKKQETHGIDGKQQACQQLGLQALKKVEQELDDISVILIYF